MAKFMLIVGGADMDKRIGNPSFAPAMVEQYMAWVMGLKTSGRHIFSEKLHDQTGRRLTVRGGEVIDGPFIEAKDAVGGIFVIEAKDLDDATQVAASCPALHLQRGFVEVRLVEERPGQPRP